VCACSISYPACKAHESYYHCSLSGINIFYLHYLINSMFLGGKKKVIKQKMYVLIYSTTQSEIFHILKRIQWHTAINIHWSSYKELLFLLDINHSSDFFIGHTKSKSVCKHSSLHTRIEIKLSAGNFYITCITFILIYPPRSWTRLHVRLWLHF
jgi:hypothetical protein